MKFIFEMLLAAVPPLFNPFIKLIKLEILSIYVGEVDRARRAFSRMLMAVVAVMLAVSSFILIHAALFILIPWSLQTAAFVMLGIGVFYMTIATIVVFKICSKDAWMKMSGAQTLARSISRDDC